VYHEGVYGLLGSVPVVERGGGGRKLGARITPDGTIRAATNATTLRARNGGMNA